MIATSDFKKIGIPAGVIALIILAYVVIPQEEKFEEKITEINKKINTLEVKVALLEQKENFQQKTISNLKTDVDKINCKIHDIC